MTRTARTLAITIGSIAFISAALGLYYNASILIVSFKSVFSDVAKKGDQPYFYIALYLMSAVCIICYLLLIWCGIHFVRFKFKLAWLFTWVLVFEVVYFFLIALLWMAPGIGMSVAGATGVANGGLMIQFVILFPLWAPFVIHWVKRRIAQEVHAI